MTYGALAKKRDTRSNIAPQGHRHSTGEVFPQFEKPGDEEETSIGHRPPNSTLSLITNRSLGRISYSQHLRLHNSQTTLASKDHCR